MFRYARFRLSALAAALYFAAASSSSALPQILLQPVDQLLSLLGLPLTLSVVGQDSQPLRYQWHLNGVNIPGATNALLLLPSLQTGQAGQYQVSVYNSTGAVKSRPALVTLLASALNTTDLLANAPLLTGYSGTRHTDNGTASAETGEPRHAGKTGGRSVWLRWRAPATGIATFATAGSGFDTLLGAYTGSNVTSLLPVAGDDDTGGFLTSKMRFNATAGTEYAIAIDGFNGASGNIVLSWDLQTTSALLPTVTATTQVQIVGEGEQAVLSVSADLTLVTLQWYFQGASIAGATNDSLILPSVQPAHVGVYTLRATALAQEVLSIQTDLQINRTDDTVLRDVAAFDKLGDLLAAGWEANRLKRAARKSGGTAHGYSGTQIFSTVGSTKEADEPPHCGIVGGRSEWFAWQPPVNGMAVIDTEGSAFDTVLAVYTGPGTDFSSLVSIACDNDSGADGKTSNVTFDAAAGTIYYIAVDGVNAASGTVKLNYQMQTPPLVEIQAHPQDQSVPVGQAANFSVAATGLNTLKYQWRKGQGDIPGQTNAQFLISEAQLSDAGQYCVVVRDSSGAITSAPATLLVIEPPAITEQMPSGQVAWGSDVLLSVNLSGTEPFQFQWFHDGAPIPGGTNETLLINNFSTMHTGAYSVDISNSAGAARSEETLLNDDMPPQITLQPQPQTVLAGGTAFFRAGAQGSQPLHFQWMLDGQPIPKATNDTLIVSPARLRDAGNYSALAINPFGTAASEPAQLTVNFPILPFADHFADAQNIQNNYFAGRGFNIGATREPGEPRHDNRRGVHSVWISWTAPANGIAAINTAGSDFDTLLAVYRGNFVNALFPVESDDDSGPTNTSFLRFNADAGVTYHIAIDGYNNARGAVQLECEFMPTLERLPQFLSHPRHFAVLPGQDAPLDFIHSSDNAAEIQWLFKGADVANATMPNFVVRAVSEEMVGAYRARLVTSNHVILSRIAEVQINTRGFSNVLAMDKFADAQDFGQFITVPVAPVPPQGAATKAARKTGGSGAHGFSSTQIFSTIGSTAEPGEPAHCGVGSGRSEWFTYQAEADGWMKIDTDGSNFDTVLAVYTGPGTDFESLVSVACDNNSGLDAHDSAVLFQATQGTIYYIAVDSVTNTTPTGGTVKLHIHLGDPVTIASQPESQVVASGTDVSFFAEANGMTNYAYQWRFNGANIVGATNDTFTRNNVLSTDAGEYDFIVSNPLNAATSSVAVLTVYSSTVNIVTQPQDTTVAIGASALLSVVATGLPPLSYQWQFGGNDFVGATNSTLPLLNVQASDAGAYSVEITDANGALLSSICLLQILAPPSITLQPSSSTLAPGASHTLIAAASGTPAPSLQWHFNDAPVPGGTSGGLQIANFQAMNEGSYFLRASNAAGMADSASVELLLNTPLRLTNLVRGPDAFRGRLIGVAAGTYILCASSDLSTWTSLGTNSLASGLWDFIDSAASNAPVRFYRAYSIP